MTDPEWSDHYGEELTLRLSAVSEQTALSDDRAVADLLRTLVDDIGMRVLAGPIVGTEEGTPDKAGKSAVVILAESHAAVHTYPGLGEVFFNVFSCKPFAPQTVLATLERLIGSFVITEQRCVRRGEDWPQCIDAAAARWRRDR